MSISDNWTNNNMQGIISFSPGLQDVNSDPNTYLFIPSSTSVPSEIGSSINYGNPSVVTTPGILAVTSVTIFHNISMLAATYRILHYNFHLDASTGDYWTGTIRDLQSSKVIRLSGTGNTITTSFVEEEKSPQPMDSCLISIDPFDKWLEPREA